MPTPEAEARQRQLANQALIGLGGDVETNKRNLQLVSQRLTDAERRLSHLPGHLRGLQRHSRQIIALRSQVTELIRSNAVNGDVDPNAIKALRDLVEAALGNVAVMENQVAQNTRDIDVLNGRVTLIERDPALQIDFGASTRVPFGGRVESGDSWVFWFLSLVIGACTGVISGMVASAFMYEYKEWDWTVGKSVLVGACIGLASFFFITSFERLRVNGVGWITWATRPSMEEQADALARETADQIPPPVNCTTVQPATPQNAQA